MATSGGKAVLQSFKIGLFASAVLLPVTNLFAKKDKAPEKKQPNVIFILADDLGIGDLGSYGQKVIKTPAVDNLAATGMLFTQHYSGSTVSAPSRCALMTGKHTGHCYIRGNKATPNESENGHNFDFPLAKGEITVADIFKQAGYQTACVGKWGLGGPHTEGEPDNHGFDYFFGYLGQADAHAYYPNVLWENNNKVVLNKTVYSPDLIMEKALTFIKENENKPFFLYLAPTIPHAELIVPEGELGEYDGMFKETPYTYKRNEGYCSQPKPRATYAAMVTRLDSGVQQVVDLLKKLGLYENTIIIFTSDNGAHVEGGNDPAFFKSSGIYRGTKRDLYEGGIHTPFIVSYPAGIKPGVTTNHVSAFWDFLPTVCDLTGIKKPASIDGISFLPTLFGKKGQKEHDYLYFEFHERNGSRCIIKDNWKLLQLNVDNQKKTTWELYDLKTDPSEKNNVIAQNSSRFDSLKKIMLKARTRNESWDFQQDE